MTEGTRLVSAPLVIDYEEISATRDADFRFEYEKLSQVDDDPISQWLKMAKARGETKDSDTVLLHLILELHRKVDAIERLLKNEQHAFLELKNMSSVDKIGHAVFELLKDELKKDMEYYGRIDLPTFPRRIVPIYFTAIDARSAKVKLLHDRDIKDWDMYITARERALIREKKGNYV